MATGFGHQLEFIQHNHEGVLIDLIHAAGKHEVDYIIINPAAFTHTSVALRDALAAVAIPYNRSPPSQTSTAANPSASTPTSATSRKASSAASARPATNWR